MSNYTIFYSLLHAEKPTAPPLCFLSRCHAVGISRFCDVTILSRPDLVSTRREQLVAIVAKNLVLPKKKKKIEEEEEEGGKAIK